MKKIYFAPETNVYQVETQQILAGSPVAEMFRQDAQGAALSRQKDDFWDDEEEDEY